MRYVCYRRHLPCDRRQVPIAQAAPNDRGELDVMNIDKTSLCSLKALKPAKQELIATIGVSGPTSTCARSATSRSSRASPRGRMTLVGRLRRGTADELPIGGDGIDLGPPNLSSSRSSRISPECSAALARCFRQGIAEKLPIEGDDVHPGLFAPSSCSCLTSSRLSSAPSESLRR